MGVTCFAYAEAELSSRWLRDLARTRWTYVWAVVAETVQRGQLPGWHSVSLSLSLSRSLATRFVCEAWRVGARPVPGCWHVIQRQQRRTRNNTDAFQLVPERHGSGYVPVL